MKRMMFMGVAMLLGLFLAMTVQAQPAGSWNSPDDFTTKFWKEKFFGGGPGQPGNTLMAIGQGFVFQNAVLVSVVCGTPADWCDGAFSCVTGYEGGMLTLNPSGPWKKNLKARKVTATNTSCHDGEGALLGFSLAMAGQFDKSPYYFDIVAAFDVTDDNYEVKTDPIDGVVFQRGFAFDAIITIY